MKRTRIPLFTVLLDRLELSPTYREQAVKLLNKSPDEIKTLAETAVKRLRATKQQVYLMSSRDPVCGSGAKNSTLLGLAILLTLKTASSPTAYRTVNFARAARTS